MPPEETDLYPEGWDKIKVDVAEVLQKEGDTEKVKIPVPKGFVVSEIATEKTIDDGLVIYEIPESQIETVDWTADVNKNTFLDVQENYNQFVWVPVSEPSQMYGIATDGKYLGKLYDFRNKFST